MIVWTCKIGSTDLFGVGPGSDGSMRSAVSKAFYLLHGEECEFCFSGWGGKLDENELACILNTEPAISDFDRLKYSFMDARWDAKNNPDDEYKQKVYRDIADEFSDFLIKEMDGK